MGDSILNRRYQVSRDVIYEGVDGEFVVLQIGSGRFFYYSAETESFFQLFECPNGVTELTSHGIIPADELPLVQEMVQQMINVGLLEEVPGNAATERPKVGYRRPRLLREGRNCLEDIVSAVPF